MDYSLSMRVVQGVGDLHTVVERLIQCGQARAHHVVQGLPSDQRHHNERLAVRFPDFIDRADVGVAEHRGVPRLADQAAPRGRVRE